MASQGIIQVAYETKTKPLLVGYDVQTETRFKSGSTTEEETRTILRVTLEIDLFNVTDLGQIENSPAVQTTAIAYFNQNIPIILYPIKDKDTPGTIYQFRVVGQSLTPMEVRGSKFMRLTNDLVSVSGWTDIDWSADAA
jgi:hypothetical protein